MDNERVWTNPDLRPNPIWLRWLKRINWRREGRIFAISGAIVAAIGWWGSRADEDGAKVVLADTLEVPSWTKYISFDTLAKEGDWRMQRVVFEVGDSRESVCVTYRLDGGQYRWRRDEGVRDCTKPPSPDDIARLKQINGWPGIATASAD